MTRVVPMQAQAKNVDNLPPFVIVVDKHDSLPDFTDDELWNKGVAITFKVNKTFIIPTDTGYVQLINAMHNVPNGFTYCRLLVLRGSASPEGPAWNNTRLAHGRAQALVDSLRRYISVPDFSVEERYISEDYNGLRHMIGNSSYTYKEEVMDILRQHHDDATTKKKLQALHDGRVWKELLRDYFPVLRATRVVVVVSQDPMELPISGILYDTEAEASEPDIALPVVPITMNLPAQPQRELLAVKTNLLFDAAWVPQYGFCPIPNVEIEYYPLRGHWTYGATFDCPWWQSSAYNSHTEKSTGKNHKFFQIRNYQLLARWYAHDGSGVDGFHGLYVYPYINVAIFGIGFKADKGWMGEGLGGGIGAGYKLPLGKINTVDGRTRASHWHLEFGAQFGMFAYKYDPYQWGCVHGYIDGHYYYRYYGDKSHFHKRDHHKIWLGPTRVSVTLSYDLLYRSRKNLKSKGGGK